MDELIIGFAPSFNPGSWMKININRVCIDTGRKFKCENKLYVDYPMTKAKKLFKLIREWASEEDIQRVDEYVEAQSNPKAKKAWKESGEGRICRCIW